MRVIVFFDLPTETKEQRKSATQFRKFLIKDGYYMIQYSVYGRLSNTIENAKLHENRLLLNLPHVGSVRSMIVTEKQYAEMKCLLCKPLKEERSILEKQISMF